MLFGCDSFGCDGAFGCDSVIWCDVLDVFDCEFEFGFHIVLGHRCSLSGVILSYVIA